MDNAGKGWKILFHAFQHVVQGLLAGNIGQLYDDVGALLSQPLDGLFRLGVRGTASIEHYRSCAALDQPVGDCAADSSQAARNEIRAIGLQAASG